MRNRFRWVILALCTFTAAGVLVTSGLVWGQRSSELSGDQAPPDAVWLDSLDLTKMSAGWGEPQGGLSCEKTPLTLKGVVYKHGVGTHAMSEVTIDLKGVATRFESMVGLDDERTGRGSITFEVWVDDKLAAQTPVLHGGDTPKLLSVVLTGAQRLTLIAGDAGDGIDCDHADWAGALIHVKPGAAERAQTMLLPPEPPVPIKHIVAQPVPAIHGPRIVGCSPGKPFLFLIPATGQGRLAYSAKGLPAGLALDSRSGIITGAVRKAGTYRAQIAVRGPRGVGRRGLTIVAGTGKLALTPPMGWNSWYVWFGEVSDAKMRAAADGLVQSGLAAHGWQYVNIDDCWEGKRATDGEIQSNERFPDMKGLADYIHAQGLRFGIYTSPGPKTCGGYEGSWKHEEQDVRTYARWGVDFVKHDWCSYGEIATGDGVEKFINPYRHMGQVLARAERDMVFSLCQYGMGEVWKWGAQVGGNLWRTTGDSGDTWGAVAGIGFQQAGLEKWAGSGHWNDPDMLMVGHLGGGATHPTRMTPNEQISQMTLWCMIAAPLLLSCDLTKLDPFTLDLLTNDEVLDINQDPLGKAAGRRAKEGMTEAWSRPLSDGSTAVALFNRGTVRSTVTARWTDVGVKGSQRVRDLWQQKNLGVYRGAFSASVPAHGCMLLKLAN